MTTRLELFSKYWREFLALFDGHHAAEKLCAFSESEAYDNVMIWLQLMDPSAIMLAPGTVSKEVALNTLSLLQMADIADDIKEASEDTIDEMLNYLALFGAILRS